MYFPVLRSRQEELRALEVSSPLIVASRNLIPIIEPAGDHPLRLAAILNAGVTCCLIVNPGVGPYVGTPIPPQYQVLASHHNVIPTLLIDGATTPSTVATFVGSHSGRRAFYYRRIPPQHALVAATVATANPTYVVIQSNCIPPIAGLSRDAHVDVRDVFAQRNNADYPTDEPFTNRHVTIAGDPQFAHFGDFSIVGETFPVGIMIARAAAAHIVYAVSPKPQELRIRHYVGRNILGQPAQSIPTLTLQAITAADADRPTLNALAQLNDTPASNVWQTFLAPPHNPGLGMVKRIGIRHHLELMTGI